MKTETRNPPPSTTITSLPSPPITYPPVTPTLEGEVEGARLIFAFIQAYNAGQLDEALGLVTERIGVSDCDYEAVGVITFAGKADVREWLLQRFADHDQLVVQRIYTDEGGGGIVYARRTSDTLRRLGFVDGIKPNGATKVIFNEIQNPKRINVFANGPVGGDQEFCRPSSG